MLEVGPFEGEHRNGAIAFVRFSGLDEVIQTEGAEAAADALNALVRTIQAAAAEHGVTFLESDVDRDGGRIILVSGAPRTFGDDEERMLRTLRAAVDFGLPLPVHIGTNRGRFFTGQVGATFRRTYTVLGDTAALAARLMARAGEDEIYVSAEAFARGGSELRRRRARAVHGQGEERAGAGVRPRRDRRGCARGRALPSRARRSRSSTANANAPCSTRRSRRCGWASARSWS